MKSNIISAYTELKNLKNGKSHSIAQVNWWLLKYGDLYKTIVNNQNKLCSNCLDLEAENLPYDCLSKPNHCNKIPELKSFIGFYDELDKVTQLHKLKRKCYNAFDEYMFLHCLNENMRDWVIKHYETYFNLSGFFYSYLDYDLSDNERDLHIANAPDESFGVCVNRVDFQSVTNFHKVYDDLYNNQKLYPEKIKENDEFFLKIQLPEKDK